jgi:NADP-dependent 3-hydroxy acid dehydrogenase YdfG
MGEIQDPKTQEELIKGTVKKFGRLDVLVNYQ